jgi:hypothetical protein
MILTRTRLILIAIISAIVIIGIACGGTSGSDGDTATESPQGSDLAGGAERQGSDDTLAYQSEEARSGEAAALGLPDALPANSFADTEESPSTNPQLQSLLDRKIIQSTSVDIKVEEVGRQFQEIIRIAETAGGFVAGSTFSNVDDQQFADITIRVPGDRYQDVLAQIRGMGEVTTESSDANDVTEEFTDLQARLRTLTATERRYLELLGQAVTINDILVVQDRLDFVRGQIEQVQGRINLVENLTDLATITTHLRPLAAVAPVDDGGTLNPLEAAAGAWELSLDALRGLAIAVLVVAAFSWWLVPPLGAAAIAGRWWIARQQRTGTETSI